MNNLHVKTGDNVMVISGKDKGKNADDLLTIIPAGYLSFSHNL